MEDVVVRTAQSKSRACKRALSWSPGMLKRNSVDTVDAADL